MRKTTFYVGSVSRPGPYFEARGQGLNVCELEEETGRLTLSFHQPEAYNVLWMAHRNNRLFAACENYRSPGEILAFRVTDSGSLELSGQAYASAGGGICHLECLEEGVLATSYFGGVTTHPFSFDGWVAPATHTFVYPSLTPQAESHPHQATLAPDGSLIVCDLGNDCLWIHTAKPGGWDEPQVLTQVAGSGFRQLAWHGNQEQFSVLGEVDGQVRTYQKNGTQWHCLSHQPAVPEGWKGKIQAAALKLHPSGQTLYASDRGSHTLTCLSTQASPHVSHFACGGMTPRDFAFSPSGRWLLVALQDSDFVVAFELHPETGWPTGHSASPLPCGSPMCVSF